MGYQSGGKAQKEERWGREYKKHRDKFDTAEAFMKWYNNRIHADFRLLRAIKQ